MKVIIFIVVACFTTVLSLPVHEINDTFNTTTTPEYNISDSQPTIATPSYNLTNSNSSAEESLFLTLSGGLSKKEGNANTRPSPSSSPELSTNENATILNFGGSATSVAVIKPETGSSSLNLENPSSPIFISKPPGLPVGPKPHRPLVITKIKPVWSVYEVLQNRNRNKPFYYYQPETQLPQETTSMYELLQNTNRNKPLYYYQPETQLSATQLSQLSQLSQVSQDTSMYEVLQNTNRFKPIYYEPQTQTSQDPSVYELPSLKNQYYSESQDTSSASVIQNDNSLSNVGGGGGGGVGAVNTVNLAIAPSQIQTVQLTT